MEAWSSEGHSKCINNRRFFTLLETSLTSSLSFDATSTQANRRCVRRANATKLPTESFPGGERVNHYHYQYHNSKSKSRSRSRSKSGERTGKWTFEIYSDS